MNIINKLTEQIKGFKDSKKNALIIIVGVVAIALIFISELDFNTDENTFYTSYEASTNDYCSYLEAKVTEIVQSIDGAGETRVMITLSETTEYVYATNDRDVRKTDEDNNDSTNESDYVIIESNSNDTGLLIKTIEPKVRGVAVVCEGGDNVKVQNQIYSAVGAVLNLSTSRISISKLSNMEAKNEK